MPFLKDGETSLTESTAILLYLVERYQHVKLGLPVNHPEYGDYLNWLFQSDTTFTFPQAIVLRYSQLEVKERQNPQVVTDYKIWFLARLKQLDNHLSQHEFLVANRFTIADIAVGYALYLGQLLGLDKEYQPQTYAYLQRLKARAAFKQVVDTGKEVADYQIDAHWQEKS